MPASQPKWPWLTKMAYPATNSAELRAHGSSSSHHIRTWSQLELVNEGSSIKHDFLQVLIHSHVFKWGECDDKCHMTKCFISLEISISFEVTRKFSQTYTLSESIKPTKTAWEFVNPQLEKISFKTSQWIKLETQKLNPFQPFLVHISLHGKMRRYHMMTA